jgi:hypothetical protein
MVELQGFEDEGLLNPKSYADSTDESLQIL